MKILFFFWKAIKIAGLARKISVGWVSGNTGISLGLTVKCRHEKFAEEELQTKSGENMRNSGNYLYIKWCCFFFVLFFLWVRDVYSLSRLTHFRLRKTKQEGGMWKISKGQIHIITVVTWSGGQYHVEWLSWYHQITWDASRRVWSDDTSSSKRCDTVWYNSVFIIYLFCLFFV